MLVLSNIKERIESKFCTESTKSKKKIEKKDKIYDERFQSFCWETMGQGW